MLVTELPPGSCDGSCRCRYGTRHSTSQEAGEEVALKSVWPQAQLRGYEAMQSRYALEVRLTGNARCTPDGRQGQGAVSW